MQKLLKISVALIGVLILVFLLTGFVKPVVKYDTKVQINKPLEEVWNTFNDMAQIHNWIPEVTHIETVSETPQKVGSTYIMTVDNQGESITMKERVLEYKEFKEVSLYFDAGSMKKNDQYLFSEHQGFTQIIGYHECKGDNYFHQCMFAFLGSIFKGIDQDAQDRFKVYIEKD